jgi:hypothetical protein
MDQGMMVDRLERKGKGDMRMAEHEKQAPAIDTECLSPSASQAISASESHGRHFWNATNEQARSVPVEALALYAH